MSRFLLLATALVSGSCGKGAEPQAHAPPQAPQPPQPAWIDPGPRKGSAEVEAETAGKCAVLPFAQSTPVPEASGAAWLTVDGALSLVVISDSGNDGAYAVVDPETGKTTEQGTLPLGSAGQDIEGFAALGTRLYGLTSSGWMRTWERRGKGFALVGKPAPLGRVDLPDENSRDTPPKGTGMVCGARATNCGRNYEGLCLVDEAHRKGPCVGFAAAKADGHLYCLVEKAGAFVVQHDQAIAITRPGALADCAFDADGTLWAGANLFDLSQVWRVDGWNAPATAVVTPFAPLGVGFPETLAVRGDVFYRMSDTGGAPSLMAKYRCTR